jgi:hypothetical protein
MFVVLDCDGYKFLSFCGAGHDKTLPFFSVWRPFCTALPLIN